MKYNASPWTFLLIVLAKRFILYHVFSPSYIYRGENVCSNITLFTLFFYCILCTTFDSFPLLSYRLRANV